MNQTERILKSKGISPTAMRVVVLNYLNMQDHALSLTDIELGIDTADRVTIYRTLKTFESHGLVHSIGDGSGTQKFALCEPLCSRERHQDIHPHFYCTSCQETICLPTMKIPDVQLPANFKAEQKELIFKGRCASCNS